MERKVTCRKTSAIPIRRPACLGVPGTVAQTLRAQLRRNDDAWDREVPNSGIEELPTTQLRKLAGALGVKQGDRNQSTLLKAIAAVRDERIALLEGTWTLEAVDAESSGDG